MDSCTAIAVVRSSDQLGQPQLHAANHATRYALSLSLVISSHLRVCFILTVGVRYVTTVDYSCRPPATPQLYRLQKHTKRLNDIGVSFSLLSTHADRQRVDISVTVCLCVFVYYYYYYYYYTQISILPYGRNFRCGGRAGQVMLVSVHCIRQVK